MKAIVCTSYGSPDVLELREVDKPTPKAKEVLIKIYASTVTTADCRIRRFDSPILFWLPMRLVLGVARPRKPILGVEFAGVIEAAGQDVSRFRAGDSVYGMTGLRFGGHAEYVCLPEDATIARMADGATFEEAAALSFGGTTAMHFFRKGKLAAGHKVLIYGASGAVGTAAVQLAKFYGADVTAVCSGANRELAKSLGADQVIDYTREAFADRADRYDIVFDAVGKLPGPAGRKLLAPGGKFLTVEGQGVAKELAEDLTFMNGLMESGKLRAVIDRRYTLEQVPEAHRYVDTGRKKGNVVIKVVPDSRES